METELAKKGNTSVDFSTDTLQTSPFIQSSLFLLGNEASGVSEINNKIDLSYTL